MVVAAIHDSRLIAPAHHAFFVHTIAHICVELQREMSCAILLGPTGAVLFQYCDEKAVVVVEVIVQGRDVSTRRQEAMGVHKPDRSVRDDIRERDIAEACGEECKRLESSRSGLSAEPDPAVPVRVSSSCSQEPPDPSASAESAQRYLCRAPRDRS